MSLVSLVSPTPLTPVLAWPCDLFYRLFVGKRTLKRWLNRIGDPFGSHTDQTGVWVRQPTDLCGGSAVFHITEPQLPFVIGTPAEEETIVDGEAGFIHSCNRCDTTGENLNLGCQGYLKYSKIQALAKLNIISHQVKFKVNCPGCRSNKGLTDSPQQDDQTSAQLPECGSHGQLAQCPSVLSRWCPTPIGFDQP